MRATFALRVFNPSLEEQPVLVKVRRYLGAVVRRPLDEPSRAIEPVRLDHESSRVQPNDVHAEVDGPSDQVVEHSRSNVQRARLRHDIHALDLSRSVGKTAKGSDPDRAACPLREQEKPRRASVGTQRHGDLRGIRRLGFSSTPCSSRSRSPPQVRYAAISLAAAASSASDRASRISTSEGSIVRQFYAERAQRTSGFARRVSRGRLGARRAGRPDLTFDGSRW